MPDTSVKVNPLRRTYRVARKRDRSVSYEGWPVLELKKRAKELGLSGYSGLNKDELIGGTADTIVFARRYRKPCFIIDLERPPNFPVVREWVQREAIRVLNIAGPRESKRPGIYQESVCWLRKLLSSEGSDPNRET